MYLHAGHMYSTAESHDVTTILGSCGGNDPGLRNIEAARRLLDEAGIPIIHEDVVGIRGVKLVYRTDDGSFVLKRL